MRKTKPKKRILLPDPKFNDVLVTRFVNDLMVDGKKTVAFKIFYDALDIVEEKMAKKEGESAISPQYTTSLPVFLFLFPPKMRHFLMPP